MQGKSILGLHMIYGKFQGGTKVGKGVDLGDLRRYKCSKTEA